MYLCLKIIWTRIAQGNVFRANEMAYLTLLFSAARQSKKKQKLIREMKKRRNQIYDKPKFSTSQIASVFVAAYMRIKSTLHIMKFNSTEVRAHTVRHNVRIVRNA